MVETSGGKIPNINPRASTPDIAIILLLPTLTYLNEDTGGWIKVGIDHSAIFLPNSTRESIFQLQHIYKMC
jgi:hypothetical protein